MACKNFDKEEQLLQTKERERWTIYKQFIRGRWLRKKREIVNFKWVRHFFWEILKEKYTTFVDGPGIIKEIIIFLPN